MRFHNKILNDGSKHVEGGHAGVEDSAGQTQYPINIHWFYCNVDVKKGPTDSLVRAPWEGLLSLLAPFSSLSPTCSPGVFSSPRGKPRRPGSCAPDSQVPGKLRNPLLFLRDYCC